MKLNLVEVKARVVKAGKTIAYKAPRYALGLSVLAAVGIVKTTKAVRKGLDHVYTLGVRALDDINSSLINKDDKQNGTASEPHDIYVDVESEKSKPIFHACPLCGQEMKRVENPATGIDSYECTGNGDHYVSETI